MIKPMQAGLLLAALQIGFWAHCAAAEQSASEDVFPADQIEQMVAPIALYPDALIAQLLMASTYPLDVVQADRWLGDHGDLEGESLQQAVDEQSWDDSVKALVFFPSVLDFMSDNLDWTQDLGDAVLAQQSDVTDAIQHLRDQADAAGALESNEQQRVEKSGDTILIQPAQPEIVYVPTYDPVQAYGQASPPAQQYYADAYADATETYASGYAAGLADAQPAGSAQPATTVETSSGTSGLVNFGFGALAGGLLTAAILWDDDDDDRIYYGGRGYYGAPGYWGRPAYWNDNGWRQPNNIDIDRNVNVEGGAVNINKGIVGNEIDRDRIGRWQHNPEHRGGVRYRDGEAKQRFAEKRREGGIDRDEARGRVRDATRDIKAPDLAKVKREGAATGGLAKLSDRAGDGKAASALKERAGGADLKAKAPQIQAKAPAIKAKAPAVKAQVRTKPKVQAAAAKKRPVNKQAQRPKVANIQRPTQAAGKPKIASAAAKRKTSTAGRAFQPAKKANVSRAASYRGAASRGAARPSGGVGARRR